MAASQRAWGRDVNQIPVCLGVQYNTYLRDHAIFEQECSRNTRFEFPSPNDLDA